MKKVKLFSNKYVSYSFILLAGFLAGWLIFHPSKKSEVIHDHREVIAQETIWTCSMHPQIKLNKPGLCPLCGMELIPLNQNGTVSADPDAVHMTPEAAALADVTTSIVTRQSPVTEVRLYGKVQVDERLLQSQVAHIAGRIESLAVDFTGEPVVTGQVLGTIYSPDLITAQQELLEAARTKDDLPALYQAARGRLVLWKLTDKQINEVERSGVVRNATEIISNSNGVVISRRVNKGDYVSQGAVLFEIADLSKVWVMFDAYESDLNLLHPGAEVAFALQAIPGTGYTGKITFIDKVIDPLTRIARVRVEADNRSGRFKPGMFATGIVSSASGKSGDKLVIPGSSVLWTGKRSVVYVKQGSEEPVFKMREIELGAQAGDGYIVIDGLMEGEEIVTRGAFSVDAAAQLEGKPSMMNSSAGI